MFLWSKQGRMCALSIDNFVDGWSCDKTIANPKEIARVFSSSVLSYLCLHGRIEIREYIYRDHECTNANIGISLFDFVIEFS